MANVQITEDLFLALVKYHLYGDVTQGQVINKALQDKLEKMLNRKLYSEYKTAPTQEERESARKDYLNRKGINKDFKW